MHSQAQFQPDAFGLALNTPHFGHGTRSIVGVLNTSHAQVFLLRPHTPCLSFALFSFADLLLLAQLFSVAHLFSFPHQKTSVNPAALLWASLDHQFNSVCRADTSCFVLLIFAC